MKKWLYLLLLILPILTFAQGQQASLSNPLGADLIASSTNCSVVLSCAWMKLPAPTTTVTVTVSGTFSATLQFEQSGDGVNFVSASPASTTTTGTTTFTVTSLTDFRVRASAYTSGKASVNIQASGNQINITSTGGGGITSVTILPATCTPGVTAPVQLSVAPFGIYYCSATNIWAQYPQTPNVINPTLPPYNAPLTQSCANLSVTLTNGSNQVSCSTATFTSADIGKVIFASCCGGLGGTNKVNSTLKVTQGVINSIVNSTTVTVCTTTGACTPVNSTANSSNGTLLYWGFKATSQVVSALAAVYAGPGPCAQFFWSGILMVDTGLGNTAPACIYPIGATFDSNLSIQGTGRANSILLMSPDFNFATCTGLHTSCFFGVQGVERKYFGINGGGRGNTGSNSFAIVSSEIDDFDYDLGISDIGASDTALIGYSMNSAGAYPNFVECDGAGFVCIQITTGQWNTLVGGYAADTKGGCMTVNGSSAVNTTGLYFGPAISSGGVNCVTVNGTWNSTNDVCLTGAGTNCVNNNGGTAHLTNFVISSQLATPDHGLFSGNAASKTYVVNSTLLGTINPILNSNGTLFVDEKTTYAGGGTNSYAAGTILIADGHSLKGACTGVGTAASTLGLYGTGPNVTATTCTSTNIGSGLTINGARTLQNLIVSATAAGTNASSGVVTVLKNGGATTITCTIGTATSCVDNTHTVAFADGDLVSIQFTTQAADTLAGVKAQVVW